MNGRGGSRRPGTAARSRRGLLGGCLLFAAAALAGLPLPPDGGALAVRVSPWTLPSRPLVLTLEQRGLLAGRHLAIYVFVDQNLIDRVTTAADRTRVRLPVSGLMPGRHVLMVKSGREVAQAEFRVIAWSWIAGSGALLLVGSGIGLWLALGRERRKRGPRQR